MCSILLLNSLDSSNLICRVSSVLILVSYQVKSITSTNFRLLLTSSCTVRLKKVSETKAEKRTALGSISIMLIGNSIVTRKDIYVRQALNLSS